jgi:ketosteroid isomerase-like protein
MMRRNGWVAGLVLGVAFPMGLLAQEGATREQARVEAVVRAAFALSEAGQLSALDTIYTANATIVEGAGLDRSWGNYRDHHLAPELKAFADFRYRPSEIEVMVDGPLAWVMFRYTLSATMGERRIDNVGRGTMILERTGDRWRIRHSHTSSRARRATDAP